MKNIQEGFDNITKTLTSKEFTKTALKTTRVTALLFASAATAFVAFTSLSFALTIPACAWWAAEFALAGFSTTTATVASALLYDHALEVLNT